MGDVPVPPEPRPHLSLPAQQEQQHETPVPKRSAWDRLFRKAAHPERSRGHAPEDEPGVGPEADQQAIDDEFWKRK